LSGKCSDLANHNTDYQRYRLCKAEYFIFIDSLPLDCCEPFTHFIKRCCSQRY